MATLIWRNEGKIEKCVLEENDLKGSVGELLTKAKELTQLEREKMQFLYLGKILRQTQEDDSLEKCGVKPGGKIYVLRKPEKITPEPLEPKNLSENDIKQLCLAFGMASHNPALDVVMKRLGERENLESLAAACPGLAKDPVALALLSKPEMLLLLLKPETLQKLGKEHPSFYEALVNISAAVHEERPSSSSATAASSNSLGASSGALESFSYHLDEMGEDEDEEDDDGMDVDGEGGSSINDLQRNRSFSVITPDQLAAAIASAQGRPIAQPNSSSAGGSGPAASGLLNFPGSVFQGMTPPTGSGSSTASTPRQSFITPDMFQAAMQQAMQTSTASSTATTTTNTPTGSAAAATAASSEDNLLQVNLDKMKEMGIQDMALAKKALEVMGGDLQAAIDLIFSGWLGE